MTISYKLNPDNARAASGPTRINEKGAYVGKFTRAEAITANSGSQGVEFTFEADDGRRADYLTLWVTNRDGKELYGRRVLDALMTCLKAREISAQPTPVKRPNGNTETPLQFRELMGAPVGLFLISEEYEKNDGSIGSKMVIFMPFEAGTKRTAKEVLDKGNAEAFDRIVGTLRDRPVQARRQPVATRSPATATGTGFDNMDDDIPF